MAVNNTLQSTNKPPFSLYMSGEGVKKLVNQVVGKDAPRFVSSLISSVSTNPALSECDQKTILSAALTGYALGLSPSPQLGHFYMVPYDDRKNNRKVAQFQMGYKAYIQLAMRSGQYLDIDVLAVKDGEYIGRNNLTGKQRFSFIEDDETRDQLATVGYLAYFELLNGYRKQIYWTKEQMMRHADRYSQAFSMNETITKTKYGDKKKVSYADYIAGNYDKKDEWMYSSFWYKNFDEMAFKTLIRQLIPKWGIMSIEMQNAYEKDYSVIDENGSATIVELDDTAPFEAPTEPADNYQPPIPQQDTASNTAANTATSENLPTDDDFV